MLDRFLSSLYETFHSRSGTRRGRKGREERQQRQRTLSFMGLEERRLMAAADFEIYEEQLLGDPKPSIFLNPDIATTGDYIVSVHNSKTVANISKNNGVDWDEFDPRPDAKAQTRYLQESMQTPPFGPLTWGPFTGVQQAATDAHRGMILRTLEYGPGGDPADLSTAKNGVVLAVARTAKELDLGLWNYYEFDSLALGLERGQIIDEVRMEMSDNYAYFLGYASKVAEDPLTGFQKEFVSSVWWRIGLESLYTTGELEMGIAHVKTGLRIGMTSGAKDIIYGAALSPPGTLSTIRMYAWHDNDLGPREVDIPGLRSVGVVVPDDTGTAPVATGWVGRGRVGILWDAPRRPSDGKPFDFVRVSIFNEQLLNEVIIDPSLLIHPVTGRITYANVPGLVESEPDFFNTSASIIHPRAQATPRGDVAITLTQSFGTQTAQGPLRNFVYLDDKYTRGSDDLSDPVTFERSELLPAGTSGLLSDAAFMGLTFDDVYTDTWMTTAYKYIGTGTRSANNYFYWFGREDSERSPGRNMRGESFDVIQDGAGPGDMVDVEFSVRNTGLGASGGFKVSFYASADPNISTADILLGTAAMTNIPRVSASALKTQSVTLPDGGNAIWNSLTNGELYVGMIIDPAKAVTEYSETDNANQGLGIDRAALLGTTFAASNDTVATAIDLGIISGRRVYSQLGIKPAGDEDYFKFTAPYNGSFTATIDFPHAVGDLQLRLLDSTGTQIAISDTSRNTNGKESITFNVLNSQTYFIHVAGVSLVDRNSYKLTTDYRLANDALEDPDATQSPNGPLTDNNVLSKANDLGKFDIYTGNSITIASFDDRDYYRFKGNRTGSFTITTTFQRNNGNLKVRLLDERGNTLVTSTSGTNRETIKTNIVVNHVYYVQVDGGGLDTNFYNLRMQGVLPPVAISGNTAIVTGSANDDTIEFSPLTATNQHTVRVNGVNFPVPDTVTIFDISAAAGKDTFIYHGFDDDDTVNVSPTDVTASNGTYNLTFNITSVEAVTAEGRDGNDVLSAAGALPVSLLGDNGDDILTGGSGNDLLSGGNGIDFLDGGSGNDRLLGGNGGDVLADSNGSDYMGGNAGADLYLFDDPTGSQTDTLEELAGGGVDDLDFSFSSQAVTLNLSSTTRQIGTHGTRKLFVQTLGQAANFENLYGGFGNDNITGNVQNNIIIGGEGHDSMSGAAGDDRYIFNDPAGAQTDQIGERLNQGIDLLDFRNSTLDITVNLASNTALAMQGTRKIKMLTGFSSQYVEASFTGSGDDNIRGNNAINYIDGGAGNDFLAGGTGNDVYNFVNHTTVEQDTLSELAGGGQDTLTFQNATQAVKLDLRGTTIASYGLASIVVPTGQQANLEHVIGTDDNDILIGNNANNNLSGGTGRDVIIGGKGQDLLLGSADDDLLIGGTTSFDFTAIDEIYAEWTSNRTYTARINNIRGTTKTGLNNGKFLTSLTVSDDGTRDTLDGNLDTDWFWLGVNDLSDRVIGTELMN